MRLPGTSQADLTILTCQKINGKSHGLKETILCLKTSSFLNVLSNPMPQKGGLTQ